MNYCTINYNYCENACSCNASVVRPMKHDSQFLVTPACFYKSSAGKIFIKWLLPLHGFVKSPQNFHYYIR